MFVVLLHSLIIQDAKHSRKLNKLKASEDEDDDDCAGANSTGTIKLYGKWQLEPLQLPHAVNGIVPKVLYYLFMIVIVLLFFYYRLSTHQPISYSF